jgi:tRNA G18 (ribose-2'-O)-methylase SpoU
VWTKKRGYCGIGIEYLKKETNYGTLFRSALNFDADFIFAIGKRCRIQASDTTRAYRHIPFFEYQSSQDFIDHLPYACMLVGVEICEGSRNLVNFVHPERAIYVLGPEDGSLSAVVKQHCQAILQIPTNGCLNVAVAGSIILYDRMVKTVRGNESI